MAKYKYPSPCEQCTKENCRENGASYHHCGDYRSWINFWWKTFPKMFDQKPKKKREKFRYDHPDDIRRFLANSPCDECKKANGCASPCETYAHWFTCKMGETKWRLESGEPK